VIFILLIPLMICTWWQGNDTAGVTLCLIYMLGAAFMLGTSTVFHTFSAMSVSLYNKLAILDDVGIGVQILGSYLPIWYFLFKCVPWALALYGTLVSLSAGAVFFTTLTMNVHLAGKENCRMFLFIGFGVSLILPFPHAIVIHGWSVMWEVFWRILTMGATYLFGTFIYFNQIPERLFPGKISSFPSSHPIWHLFVLFAALYHYLICFWMVHYRNFECTK